MLVEPKTLILTEVSDNTENYSLQVCMDNRKGNIVTNATTVWTGNQTCTYDVDDFFYQAGTLTFKRFKKVASLLFATNLHILEQINRARFLNTTERMNRWLRHGIRPGART
jgi:hypothetical protein